MSIARTLCLPQHKQQHPRNSRVKPSSVISPRTRAVVDEMDLSRRQHRSSAADDYFLNGDADQDGDNSSSQTLLCVQFPNYSEVAAAMDNNATNLENDEEQQVTHFRSRPVAPSAVEDAAIVATKREPHEPRVRYIMSTRLGALPPTKGILDEYPIPKEVLDALERHRHFHVDESSPLTAFEPIRLPLRPQQS